MDTKIAIQKRQGGVLGAILLITAACFGEGSAGLPLYVGLGGFSLSLLLNLLLWITMLATGFLFLEAFSRLPKGTHFATLCRLHFGERGGAVWIVLFLVLNFCFIVSYFPYGSQIQALSLLINEFFGISAPPLLVNVVFLLVFGFIAYLGTCVTSRVNFICMVGFFTAMIAVIIQGRTRIDVRQLIPYNWPFFLLAAPGYIDSLSYQTILPTIKTYTRPFSLRAILFWGTLLSVLIYLTWSWFLISTAGRESLWEAFEQSETFLFNQDDPLFKGWVYLFFSVFNLMVSILSISIGFVDFLGDVRRVPYLERTQKDYAKDTLLAFVPAALVGTFLPKLYDNFLYPLSIFLEIGLLIVLPVILVWSLRYGENPSGERFVPGGRIVLMALLLVAFYLFFFQGILIVST